MKSADQLPVGASASDMESVRQVIEAQRRVISPDKFQAGKFLAANPDRKWNLNFDGSGVLTTPAAVKSDNKNKWQWGLQLKSYGFAGQEHTVANHASIKTDANRLTYNWENGLEETYSNDAAGIEHGFKLNSRPEQQVAGSPLTFNLGVRGDLRPRATKDKQSVQFVHATGSVVISYEKLKVWDADGKVLDARMEVAANTVQLKIQEEGARYPLTVDPLAIPGPAYFKPTPAANFSWFGFGIAISGDTMVVSAPGEAGVTGAVYVFRNTGGVWTQEAKLMASNAGLGDSFGGATGNLLWNGSVAIDGDTIVVGAPYEDGCQLGPNATVTNDTNLCLETGAAYVFVRSGTTWTQQAYLKASNAGVGDWFGFDVDISGDTIVVGAPLEDNLGKTIINGAPNEAAAPNGAGADNGAAYVFKRTGTTWAQESYLKPSNVTFVDEFGWSVAVDGDKIVVGAPFEDGTALGANASVPAGQYDYLSNPFGPLSADSGAAYVYGRTGALWAQQAYLKAFNIGTFNAVDWFGWSVDISGNTVIVGAPAENSTTTGVNSSANELGADQGAAYTYSMSSPTTWVNGAYLKANHQTVADWFGKEVAIHGSDVVVGAPLEDTAGNGINPPAVNAVQLADSGAVYNFSCIGPNCAFVTWSKQTCPAVIATANPLSPAAPSTFGNVEAISYYGNAVAVNMGTVGVGAPYEGATGTGVNPVYNLTGLDVGAAYIPGNCNMPPVITPIPQTVTATSPAVVLPIATVTDDLTALGSLVVTVVGPTTVNGVTISGITVDALGNVTATVVASATATSPAVFSLKVTDGGGLMDTKPLTITVLPNPAPVVTYPPVVNIGAGSTVTIPPPVVTDNGTVTFALVGTAPAGLGTVTVNPTTGAVTIANPVPGSYTIMVKATDNGGAMTISTITINIPKFTSSFSDPVDCKKGTIVLANPAATAQAFTLASTFTNLAGVPGSGMVTGATAPVITVTAGGLTASGTIPAGGTITVMYQAIVANGATVTVSSVATLGGVAVLPSPLVVTATVACPGIIGVSDQKPGSFLVFPYYKHDAQNKVDTRLTITNLGKLPINVHFLFMDGATCQEFDQFVCFTPNASITWKASEFDPQNKGYVIAYTVDNMGRPIAYNGLIGNGFVNDGEYVGNYGAESFASTLPVGTPLGAVATPGASWTIPFDAVALDMVPTTFVVDIQSPVDTVNQKIVLAGLTGDAYAGRLSGVTQVGTGLAYNGHEALRSFSPFISGQCFVEKIIDSTNPKVTGTLAGLIPKGEVGTLRFNVTAAVGLLMTSNKNTFNGIRTLHKVQVVKSSIIIPLLMPDCQFWVPQT